ncbi:SDR family oxidoreductase [Paenibacillus xylanilyticus]|uniref:SDR family oxidoreductase n=1 Tax=Paenibacillus xylanilyticus TaxID=248903 RepID=A0A7Y6C1R4_9BACL|nr:SDR family oxidoreductase [Paenibacillus xylanilyticus]NUU79007.1 SDR family oxidoreductase [Paenibacillus xylanilyticus]
MIIVTGASGQLGRMTVEKLLERMPAEQIGVSVRNPQKVLELQGKGVRVRQGDFNDSDSLAYAFEGATQVLIISADGFGEAIVQSHRTAIEAAKKAGANRIVYTSHMGSSPSSLFAPMKDHAATEDALQASGVPFVALRNGFYMASALMFLGDAISTGVLAAPEDGPVSWTTHTDLAEAAAIALSEQRFEGLTPGLTGTEAIDLTGVAAIASELSGRPIQRVFVSDDQYRDTLVSHGVPEAQANMLLGIFRASREGEFAHIDPTLTNLLHRSPLSVHDILKASIAAKM